MPVIAEVNTYPILRKLSTSVHPEANDNQAKPSSSYPMRLFSETMFIARPSVDPVCVFSLIIRVRSLVEGGKSVEILGKC